MKTAIIIPTYNQKDYLINLIESIKEKLKLNYKIFVVDDSGIGKIGEEIKERFKFVSVIKNKCNYGFASSVNSGIKKAKKEYNPDNFLLLNDDMKIVEKNFLRKMINAGIRDKEIGILGCRVFLNYGKEQYPKIKGRKLIEVKDVIGCCFLIKKEVIKEIGYFDEGFNKAYGEESDYCFRAKNKGFKLICVGNTSIVHYGGSSTKFFGKGEVWFLKKRNSLRLEWKHYNLKNILKHSLIHFLSILKGNPILIPTKFILLMKAYKYNFERLEEIKEFRRENA
jgi:GT2 family glycosyltransferase